MPRKEYETFLSNEDVLSIKMEAIRGKLHFFVVQYRTKINGKWRTVMRTDNCHGRPHTHVYHLQSKEFKVILDKDNSTAFNNSKSDITDNYLKIKENFLNT